MAYKTFSAEMKKKFKQKISKELVDKKRILIENPNIYQLYNDLVVGSIVSADTFWKACLFYLRILFLVDKYY